TIQYGGSMKPSNAKGLMSQPDVDGGLIGGAALVAADFVGIIKKCLTNFHVIVSLPDKGA
nr:triose-phosphate isomerase [Chitinophagales bacterium]